MADEQENKVDSLNGVEIFSVGTWYDSSGRRVKFNNEDIEEMVTNTNKLIASGELKPPLKLGHSSNQILKGQSDGDPALGHMLNLKTQAGKIISDFVNMPGVLFTAINKKRWTKVSAELAHTAKFGWYVSGIALLGAQLPAVKNLKDLEAFFSSEVSPQQVDPDICLSFSEPNFEGKEMEDTKLQEENLDLKLKFSESESKLKEQESKIAELEAKEKELAFSGAKDKVLSKYEQEVKDMKLMPHVFDKLKSHVEAQKESFTGEITFSAEIFNAVSKGYKSQDGESKTAEQKGDQRADEVIFSEISKIMASKDVDYMGAEKLLLNSQPELFKEYHTFADKEHAEITN